MWKKKWSRVLFTKLFKQLTFVINIKWVVSKVTACFEKRKILRIMTFFLTARCKNVYIADCTIVWNVLANTDNREIVSLGQGGGGTPPIFGKRWAADGLKPWPCSGQKNPYIHTLFRTTSSILWPCLGQNTRCLVLKPFIGNCNRANAHYINTVCLLGSTSKVHQPNQINYACNTLFMI